MNRQLFHKMLIEDEGLRLRCYLDTMGIPTIGVGFNLRRPDAKRRLAALGLDINEVMSGTPITHEAALALLEVTAWEAEYHAKDLVDDFEGLPEVAQRVLCCMVFQMGPERVGRFFKMRAALDRRYFLSAADEMLDSDWARQTPERAQRLAALMRGAGGSNEMA